MAQEILGSNKDKTYKTMRTASAWKIATSIAAVMAAGILTSSAALTAMTITDGTTTTTILDGGVGDVNPSAGAVTWVGGLGNWTFTVDTGTSKPLIGGVFNPLMDLNFVANSTGAGTLTITFTDDGFGPLSSDAASPRLTIGGGLNPGASLTYSALVAGDLITMPTILAPSPSAGAYAYANTVYGNADGLSLSSFSLVQTVVINHSTAGITSGNADILVPVPEPTTMIAGALLLLPFAASTLRWKRKKS